MSTSPKTDAFFASTLKTPDNVRAFCRQLEEQLATQHKRGSELEAVVARLTAELHTALQQHPGENPNYVSVLKIYLDSLTAELAEAKTWAVKCEVSQAAWQEKHAEELEKNDAFRTERAAAQAHIAELERDSARIDKLELLAQGYQDFTWGLVASEAPMTTPGWKYYVKGKQGETLRAAIDAATQEPE